MEKGIGLFSFIVAIITSILMFIVVPAIAFTAISTGNVALIIPAAILGVIIFILAVIGIILGIIGNMKDESKTFAIIGLIFSIICLILIIGAMAIGAYLFQTVGTGT